MPFMDKNINQKPDGARGNYIYELLMVMKGGLTWGGEHNKIYR